MAMFRCDGGGGVKVLYAGNVALKGYTGSSESKYISGQVFIGKDLKNVKCAATLISNNDVYVGYVNETLSFNFYGSCSYDSSTGYITVRYNTTIGGFYGGGSGTAYLVAVKEK